MEFIIAQIFGLISVIIGIISFQLKDMKKILICQLLCNAFMVLNYLFLGGISGAGIAFIAIVQSMVFYMYNVQNKKTPLVITISFMMMFVLLSLLTYKSFVDILPCIAAVAFAVSLTQKEASGYRICMLINVLVWVGYDLSVMAYTSIVGRVFFVVSIVSAIVRIDLKKKSK